MAALVPLPRGLPGYTKLYGDLGPADSEVDGVVDECIKCGLRLVPCRLTALESLQHLRHGPLGSRLLGSGNIHRLVLCLVGPRRLSGSLTRRALWLRHVIKHAALPRSAQPSAP